MSTEQPISPQAVEETREGIRALIREIARLARTDLEVGEFCQEFLGRVVSAMAAVGGVVWIVGDDGRLALLSEANLQQTRLREKDEEDQLRHGRLVQKTLVEGKGLMVAPNSGADGRALQTGVPQGSDFEGSGTEGSSPQAGNPTDYLVVLAPLRTDLEPVGVLEVFQRPDTSLEARRGYLRFAQQMCELAGDFFRSRQLRNLSDRQAFWTQLEQFARAAHRGLDVRETAYTIANEGRRLIDCDRVSVAVAGGRRCRIEAISGQDVFEKRSNTVRLLRKLAEMVARTREPVWYTGETSEMAPQIEEVIQDYVDQSQSKMVGILPLVRPEAEDEPETDPEEPQPPEQVVGVLIVERIEDNRVPQPMLQRIDFVCRHGGSALANAREHHDLFLMPLWKTLGRSRLLVRARTLPKTLLVLAAAVALVACMVFVPADFQMEAAGTLEPVLRRNIFAGLDGRVEEVLVRHGDQVYHRPLLGVKDTPVPGPLTGRFEEDPEAEAGELSLLVVPEGTCSFVESGIQPDDTVRAHLPTGVDQRLEWVDLLVEEVLDGRTLRLESGPAWAIAGGVEIQLWRITALARLESTELDLNVTSVTGRQMAIHEEKLTIRRLLLADPGMSVERQNRLMGQVAELDEELRNLDTKLSLHKQTQQELLVTAPTDGIVTTWDVDHRLTDRSVRRGQLLMQVADPDGAWQLELRMPEDQVGYILQSQREIETLPAPDNRLKVTYVLATDPGTPRTGRVTEIQRVAEVRGEEGNTVLITVDLDDDFSDADNAELAAYRRSGAELQARVYCGRRSLGYVLFHDLIAFVQSRILFRL